MSVNYLPGERPAGTNAHLDWLLDELVARAAHVQKAAILSRDGIATAASGALSREDTDHLAALAAGLASLANGGALHMRSGQVRQIVVEMERGFLFVTAAGEGSCLAVQAAPQADVGLVAYEMALLVRRVGQHLEVAGRPARRSGGAM